MREWFIRKDTWACPLSLLMLSPHPRSHAQPCGSSPSRTPTPCLPDHNPRPDHSPVHSDPSLIALCRSMLSSPPDPPSASAAAAPPPPAAAEAAERRALAALAGHLRGLAGEASPATPAAAASEATLAADLDGAAGGGDGA